VTAALGKLGAQNALPELTGMLRDREPSVRREAVSSLMKLGNFLAAQALTPSLNDPDEIVREQAAQALALLSPLADIHSSEIERQKRGLEKLVGQQHSVVLREVLQFLRHENLELRRLCADVLASYQSPKALPALLEAIQDDDVYIRGVAAEGLGKLGDPVAVPALELLSREEIPVLRGIAVEALGKIGDVTCVPPLIARLEDTAVYGSAPYTRAIATVAAEALHKIGTREAMSALNSRNIVVQGTESPPSKKEV
jgi:HEAT repeat protein